jgi:hypothetical protein
MAETRMTAAKAAATRILMRDYPLGYVMTPRYPPE